MAIETLLMVDLTESEQKLVKRLSSSFDIKAKSLKKLDYKSCVDFFNTEEICLIIIHVDHNTATNVENIRWIKKTLPTPPVPLLILLSSELISTIQTYIKAGADDYIVMPLNDESFAMRFYVLLECGQAILETRRANKRDKGSEQESKEKHESEQDRDTWRLIVGYLQEGLSFFAPKHQLARRGKRAIFNKWKPVRKIATGADGAVWLVQEVETEREAVAKIPHSPDMNINSLRSAAVLKRLLYHPNIVQLIEVVKDHDKFILIQEYVKGSTLWKLLTYNISSREKEELFLQLLSVIAHIHEHKIMHRDIKPDNIIVRADGRLKLLDFGSAKEISWMDRNNSPEGTLNFMSPEQMDGKTCIASDVWALGVILYLFTLNRLPFYQDNSCYPMNIETDMVAVAPRIVSSEVSVEFEQVIMRCIERNLNKRYANAAILRDDLLNRFPDFGNGLYIPKV